MPLFRKISIISPIKLHNQDTPCIVIDASGDLYEWNNVLHLARSSFPSHFIPKWFLFTKANYLAKSVLVMYIYLEEQYFPIFGCSYHISNLWRNSWCPVNKQPVQKNPFFFNKKGILSWRKHLIMYWFIFIFHVITPICI